MDKKKYVIIFGFKEHVLLKKKIIEEKEKNVIKEVLNMVQEENSEIEEKIKEIYRLGKYEKRGAAP